MSKFHIVTFGCRSNQADSAAIRGQLCGEDNRETARAAEADLVVVNTCTVTHRSDQQVRQAVRRIHRENPAAEILVTGCYAERDPRTLAHIPGVALVLGNSEKRRIVEYLDGRLSAGEDRIASFPLSREPDTLRVQPSWAGTKTRPLVKLQDGCDCRCAYCIVPSVRGPGRSAPPEDVLCEIGRLVDQGFREIVLTGVHLGAYGKKLPSPLTLGELLRRILEVPGLGRLRLSSIEPMRFDRAIVGLAATNPLFARHFHIPMQSGSDRVLERMRRPYTGAQMLDLLKYIATDLPGAALGTDVMVGFPGETEEDFRHTYDLVCSSPLTYLHVFPFSAREGTEAYAMPERVPERVIQERASLLRRQSRANNLAFRRCFLGERLPAISLSDADEAGESVALTDNYIHARIKGARVPANRLLEVRIAEVQPDCTVAVIA